MEKFKELLKNNRTVVFFSKFEKKNMVVTSSKIFFLCFFSICISCSSPTTSIMENSGKRDYSRKPIAAYASENHSNRKLDDKYMRKMRVQQAQLCKISNDFNNRVKNNSNVAIDKLTTQLTDDLDGLLPKGRFEDWIMVVEKINNLGNNTKAVVLTLQCSLRFIGKVNSQDLFFKELKKGSSVLASGTLELPPITIEANNGQITIEHFPVIFDRKFNLSQI